MFKVDLAHQNEKSKMELVVEQFIKDATAFFGICTATRAGGLFPLLQECEIILAGLCSQAGAFNYKKLLVEDLVHFAALPQDAQNFISR